MNYMFLYLLYALQTKASTHCSTAEFRRFIWTRKKNIVLTSAEQNGVFSFNFH